MHAAPPAPIPAVQPIPAHAPPRPRTAAAAAGAAPWARVRARWRRHSSVLRLSGLVVVLAMCGLTILALVREQTGTEGLFVGLGLAVLPVPLLTAAFRWLDGVRPTPWQNLGFAFAWGACAATLIALLTNTFATAWLEDWLANSSPTRADSLGTTVIAPIVEECAKGAAILLLFVFRRRVFHGLVSGVVVAGIAATGFAFTENVLYLGNAYGQDTAFGNSPALYESAVASTFFVRIIVSPFAHPLFTALTGLAFGILAARPPGSRPVRLALPAVGLLAAVLLHSVWNGAADRPDHTFLFVYGLFMIPLFGVLTWLVVRTRRTTLRTVRTTLADYAAAGWLSAPEPWALGSMNARALARATARRAHGRAAARTVAEYQHVATALALLRARAEQGPTPPGFAVTERELLRQLWSRRALAAPPTVDATRTLAPAQPDGQPGPQPQTHRPTDPAPDPQPDPYEQPAPRADPRADPNASPYEPHEPYEPAGPLTGPDASTQPCRGPQMCSRPADGQPRDA